MHPGWRPELWKRVRGNTQGGGAGEGADQQELEDGRGGKGEEG